MASEGRTGVSRFLIGSVTEKVIRHAPCSVMIVRDKAR
jgi:nucleotide-binding universal stress UspA family protein